MKLNKTIKEAIFTAALKKAGIPEKKEAIRARGAELAETIRSRFLIPSDEKTISDAKKLLEPVSKKHPDICISDSHYSGMPVNVAGQKRVFYFNGNIDHDDSTPSVSKRRPYYCSVLQADDPLTERLYAIDHDRQMLKAEIEQLSASLWAVLNSVSTDKKLIEIWPEALAFIPAAEKANTPQLPALPIADLNKMLGLP